MREILEMLLNFVGTEEVVPAIETGSKEEDDGEIVEVARHGKESANFNKIILLKHS